jgi:predicted CXXCH cytochrome family protein
MGKKKSVHKIGVDGKLCIICHEIPEQGKHSFTKIPDNTRPLCGKCHSKETEAPKYLKASPPKVISQDEDVVQHEPFKEGKCTKCHDAHESNFHKHLKKEYPEKFYVYFAVRAYELCFAADCHGGFEDAFVIPRTLTKTKFRNGNLNLHFRHVNKIKGRSCSACHDPHFSTAPKLVRDTFTFGKRSLTISYEKTETGGQCSTTCHRLVQYDRYKPVKNMVSVSPREGKDASLEELQSSREEDREERKAQEAAEQPAQEGPDTEESTDADK